jgi:hypothetical protein
MMRSPKAKAHRFHGSIAPPGLKSQAEPQRKKPGAIAPGLIAPPVLEPQAEPKEKAGAVAPAIAPPGLEPQAAGGQPGLS